MAGACGGALSAVFHVSRVAGAAPFSSRGTEWRVLRPLVIYSGILVTAMNGVLLARVLQLVAAGLHLALDYMRVLGRLLAVLLMLVGVHSAADRVTGTDTTLKLLAQIHSKLPHHCQRTKGVLEVSAKTKLRESLVVLPFFACIILRIVDGLVDARVYLNSFTAASQAAMVFSFIFECLLVLQIILTVRRVAFTLEAVNDSLQKFVPKNYDNAKESEEKDSDTTIKLPKLAWVENTASSSSDYQRITDQIPGACNSQRALSAHTARRLAQCYAALCGTVRSASDADGALLLLLLAPSTLRLGLVLYKTILWILLIEELSFSFVHTPLLFCASFLLNLVFIVEPFHNTHQQMHRTHFLVASLKLHYSDQQSVSNELGLFLRLITLDRASYSPLGMCTLQRTTAITIVATITTYLVIALTYGPEAKKPSLFADSMWIGQF